MLHLVLCAVAATGCVVEDVDPVRDGRGGGRSAADAPDPSSPEYLPYVADVAREAADYVSFAYSADGCHDRAILLAAELAAAGVPSNAQFIVADSDGSGLLTPRQHPGLEWNYHVAPVITLPGSSVPVDSKRFASIRNGEVVGGVDDHAYVVDPALYPDALVAPLATWVNDLTHQGQSGFLSLDDAREALNVPPDEARAIEYSRDTAIPVTLDQMPKLWHFQPSSSCSFLSRDAQHLEGELGSEAVERIRRTMNAGVRVLLGRMQEQDLLLDAEPIPQYPCWDF